MSEHVTFDEFRQWATEHGVNVNECVRIAFTVDSVRGEPDEPVRMEVTEYLTDGFGKRFFEGDTVAVSTRTVELRRLPSQPSPCDPEGPR